MVPWRRVLRRPRGEVVVATHNVATVTFYHSETYICLVVNEDQLSIALMIIITVPINDTYFKSYYSYSLYYDNISIVD